MFPSMDGIHLVCCFVDMCSIYKIHVHLLIACIMMQSRHYLMISVWPNGLVVIRDVGGDVSKSGYTVLE